MSSPWAAPRTARSTRRSAAGRRACPGRTRAAGRSGARPAAGGERRMQVQAEPGVAAQGARIGRGEHDPAARAVAVGAGAGEQLAADAARLRVRVYDEQRQAPQRPRGRSASEQPTTSPSRSATHAPPGSVASRRPIRRRAGPIGRGGSGGSPKRRARSWNAAMLTWWTASMSRGSSGRNDGWGTRVTLECRAVTRIDGSFRHAGQRLAYSSYGEGRRVTVLLHGLLFSRYMHDALARALEERDHRVVTLDLLGHGESDRPPDMWRYSMTEFGARGRGAARPPRGRRGGRDGHLAGRQHDARGRRRWRPSGCAAW